MEDCLVGDYVYPFRVPETGFQAQIDGVVYRFYPRYAVAFHEPEKMLEAARFCVSRIGEDVLLDHGMLMIVEPAEVVLRIEERKAAEARAKRQRILDCRIERRLERARLRK